MLIYYCVSFIEILATINLFFYVLFQQQEFNLESLKRRFETEKEITMARLDDEREKIKVCKKLLFQTLKISLEILAQKKAIP